MMLIFPGVIVLAAGLSWYLTGWLRHYSLRSSILDVPKERSSHTRPTPRGGGIAIVGITVGTVLVLGITGAIDHRSVLALLGVLPVAATGWADDRAGVTARWRFLVYFMSAVWATFWLGGLPVLRVGLTVLPLSIAGSALAVVGIVWCTNLYNFMDGIDGIAAVEAISVALFGAVLLLLSGNAGLALVLGALAGAAAGFLYWNREPARIFMGDVGSTSLGYLFVVVALISEKQQAVPLLLWVLLAGVFIVDATITVIRRALRRERWYEAHRGHAYQRAVQAGYSHGQVVARVAALNVLLGLLALAAWYNRGLVPAALMSGFVVLAIAYVVVERSRPLPRRS